MKKINHLSEIAEHLSGGKHLVFHASVNEPHSIGRQVIDGVELWPGLSIETFMPSAPCAYIGDDRISVSTVMPGGHLRHAVNNGGVNIIRESLFEQAQAYAHDKRRADMLVLQVSPPDQSGMVSLGPSIGIIPQVLAQHPYVVGVINQHMPRTNFTIPAARLNAFVEDNRPLPEFTPATSDAVDLKIAENVLNCLSDGICVEVGMGSTPDAVMRSLSQLNNIHIHTGLLNDTVMEVIEAGATRQPVTTTMAVGTAGFYDWMHDNSNVDFRPIIETHDPDHLTKLSRFHAINAALQVDLEGNVNAERIGERIISCPGGLPDFATGARRSPGGCNIIVLRSTAGREGKTTIVAKLAHKTLEGSMVDIVVTEYGIADLRGLNREDRANAIRTIAHPDAEILRI